MLPSDHVIGDVAAFRSAVAAAAVRATAGDLVTFGIQPTRPETGYGYIEAGDALDGCSARIRRFHEKPAREAAERYLAEGRFYWNSGMFLFPAKIVLSELEANAPAVAEAVAAAYAGPYCRSGFRPPAAGDLCRCA